MSNRSEASELIDNRTDGAIFMSVDPDLQLVKRCQSGDISAFDGLVHRHKDGIYRLVYRMLGGVNDVDDVAQEIFLKAYNRIRSFQCRSSFSTWLTRIALNQCINYLRNQRRVKFFPTGIFSSEDQRRPMIEPHKAAERNERFEKVYQTVNSLPPKQKAVVILYYFEEHSCEEVANILNCSVGTVKSRLFHARKTIKKNLEPYLESREWIDSGSEVGGEGYEMYKM